MDSISVEIGQDFGRVFGLKTESREAVAEASDVLLRKGLTDPEIREILDDLVRAILMYELPGDYDE